MSNKKNKENTKMALDNYVKLMRATGSISHDIHLHLREHGLTVSQFGVLEALFHLGPLSQKDAAKKNLTSTANMTTVIDNLEKHGLVRRKASPKDRRTNILHLTPEGRKLIKKIFPVHAEITAERFSILTEKEMEILGNLLRKLGSPGI